MTISEIAKAFDVSYDRVRQIVSNVDAEIEEAANREIRFPSSSTKRLIAVGAL